MHDYTELLEKLNTITDRVSYDSSALTISEIVELGTLQAKLLDLVNTIDSTKKLLSSILSDTQDEQNYCGKPAFAEPDFSALISTLRHFGIKISNKNRERGEITIYDACIEQLKTLVEILDVPSVVNYSLSVRRSGQNITIFISDFLIKTGE